MRIRLDQITVAAGLALAALPAAASAVHTTAGPVGVIGCSNTRDAVAGYHTIGGTNMWTLNQTAYSTGTVVRWATYATFWKQFKMYLAMYPDTTTVWWALCETETETYEMSAQAAETVRAKLLAIIPNATIYVSAINDYVLPHVCAITGPTGTSDMATLAAQLVSEGEALGGPDSGSLISLSQTPSDGATRQTNQTQQDGCHPNTAGAAYLGGFLEEMFG